MGEAADLGQTGHRHRQVEETVGAPRLEDAEDRHDGTGILIEDGRHQARLRAQLVDDGLGQRVGPTVELSVGEARVAVDDGNGFGRALGDQGVTIDEGTGAVLCDERAQTRS